MKTDVNRHLTESERVELYVLFKEEHDKIGRQFEELQRKMNASTLGEREIQYSQKLEDLKKSEALLVMSANLYRNNYLPQPKEDYYFKEAPKVWMQ